MYSAARAAGRGFRESGLADGIRKNITTLQAAVDFYDMLPEKTVYPAYILMLLAQAHEGLGNIQEAIQFYERALTIAAITVELLPADFDAGQTGSVLDLYRTEAFHLASDICAAVGSSGLIRDNMPLLWRGYKNLVKIMGKEFLCSPRRADVPNYQETMGYLAVYSQQMADCTGRAFVLKFSVPERWVAAGKNLLLDGLYNFFTPAADADCEAPADALDGFDIMLEGGAEERSQASDADWTTLAFSEDVKTEDDMLAALMNIEADELNVPARRSLYSMIYMLAKRLQNNNIMGQYREKLQRLQGCAENGIEDRPGCIS